MVGKSGRQSLKQRKNCGDSIGKRAEKGQVNKNSGRPRVQFNPPQESIILVIL